MIAQMAEGEDVDCHPDALDCEHVGEAEESLELSLRDRLSFFSNLAATRKSLRVGRVHGEECQQHLGFEEQQHHGDEEDEHRAQQRQPHRRQ